MDSDDLLDRDSVADLDYDSEKLYAMRTKNKSEL
jgi:hypothetical protein